MVKFIAIVAIIIIAIIFASFLITFMIGLFVLLFLAWLCGAPATINTTENGVKIQRVYRWTKCISTRRTLDK